MYKFFSNNTINLNSLWEMNPNVIIHFNSRLLYTWQNNRSHHRGGTMHGNLIDSKNCIIMQITTKINCFYFDYTKILYSVQWRSNNSFCFTRMEHFTQISYKYTVRQVSGNEAVGNCLEIIGWLNLFLFSLNNLKRAKQLNKLIQRTEYIIEIIIDKYIHIGNIKFQIVS